MSAPSRTVSARCDATPRPSCMSRGSTGPLRCRHRSRPVRTCTVGGMPHGSPCLGRSPGRAWPEGRSIPHGGDDASARVDGLVHGDDRRPIAARRRPRRGVRERRTPVGRWSRRRTSRPQAARGSPRPGRRRRRSRRRASCSGSRPRHRDASHQRAADHEWDEESTRATAADVAVVAAHLSTNTRNTSHAPWWGSSAQAIVS